MISEYEAAQLSNEPSREPYADPTSVWAGLIGTVIIIVTAALGEGPAPAADVQALRPHVSPALAESRKVYEERRARFEQARRGGAPGLQKSHSASTTGAQELRDQQADVTEMERRLLLRVEAR